MPRFQISLQRLLVPSIRESPQSRKQRVIPQMICCRSLKGPNPRWVRIQGFLRFQKGHGYLHIKTMQEIVPRRCRATQKVATFRLTGDLLLLPSVLGLQWSHV